jgi:hypothetical protein
MKLLVKHPDASGTVGMVMRTKTPRSGAGWYDGSAATG